MSTVLRMALGCALSLCAIAALGQAASPTIETWHLCELIGPGAQRPGVYGTDLGFTFVHPYRFSSTGTSADGTAADGANADADTIDPRLVFLFGDTWPAADSPCTEPPPSNDDVAATVRLADLPDYPAGPPAGGEGTASCPVLDFGAPAPLSTRPLRVLFEGRDLDLGYGRTPLSAWSDGRRPHAMFSAGELATCSDDSDCGGGQSCVRGEFGRCAVAPCAPRETCPPDPGFDDVLIPTACRLDHASDCAVAFSPRRACAEDPRGLGFCTDPTGSLWQTASRAHLPAPASARARSEAPRTDRTPGRGVSAFDVPGPDRRHLLTRWVYVTAEDPARPGVYETQTRFATAKFVNSAARTIAAFDPDDPSRNDYRPGNDTLLVWGRPWFLGADGAQSLLYLLYDKIGPATSATATSTWSPRYFAGYTENGRPRWSESEADAVPLYPSEFDLVNQLSVSWVEPLGVWVMLYGGDQPDAMKGGAGRRTHEAPEPGAVHLRWAEHPWGAAAGAPRDARSPRNPPRGAWSNPFPVLRPRDVRGLLACEAAGVPPGCAEGDPIRPLDFFRARLTGADCRTGRGSIDRGNLYAANILDVLTRAVPERQAGGRAAELVWIVSTWNPYAVQLMKSRIELP